jgi:FlaA1/EpsC-like NDP-sugar epimerase
MSACRATRPSISIIPAILIGSTLAVLLIQIADGYQVPALRSALRTLPKVLSAWTIAFAIISVLAFFMQYGLAFSRFWFAAWYVSGAVGLIIVRNIVAFGIRRWARNGIMERRAVIVGGGEIAKGLIRSIEQDADNDIRICGFFDDRDERRSPPIDRRISEAWKCRRAGGIRTHGAHRHADHRDAAERGIAGA